MSPACRLSLTCRPTFANVNAARAAITAIAADYFGIEEHTPAVMDFSLIVVELLNNAVEHSASSELTIDIALQGGEATVRLISDGLPFDPTVPVAMPDPDAPDGLPEGGFGLALVQQLADGLEYEYREQQNMVTIRKICAKATD